MSLSIVLAIAALFLAYMWLREVKSHKESVRDLLGRIAKKQIDLDVLGDKYGKLRYSHEVQGEKLKSAQDKIAFYQKKYEPEPEILKIAEWATQNAVIKNSKPEPKKEKPKPEPKKKSTSDYSSSNSISSSEPYNNHGTNQNLSEFSSSQSHSHSSLNYDYGSSSSDSYSGGGGDTGGGGSGGDW